MDLFTRSERIHTLAGQKGVDANPSSWISSLGLNPPGAQLPQTTTGPKPPTLPENSSPVQHLRTLLLDTKSWPYFVPFMGQSATSERITQGPLALTIEPPMKPTDLNLGVAAQRAGPQEPRARARP